MSGYVPVFDTLITGSLAGKWPDIGLWPLILTLADRHGVVDCIPTYIASISGLPVAEVSDCMKRFCAADPFSRTRELDGARLELLDPDGRDWGWRIVNHAKYRERARLMGKSAREVETGKNLERLAGKRASTAGDRRSPPATAVHRPSDSRSDSRSDANKKDRKTADTPAFHAEVRALYSEFCPSLGRTKTWGKARARALEARIRERASEGIEARTPEYWRKFFAKVEKIDWMCGRTERKWKADIDYLLSESGFAKVIEALQDGGAQ